MTATNTIVTKAITWTADTTAKITLDTLALPARVDIPNPGTPAGDFLEGIRDAVIDYFKATAPDHVDILGREDGGTWDDTLTDGLREAAESALPAYTHKLQVIFHDLDGWTYLSRMSEVPSFDAPGIHGPDVYGFLVAVLADVAAETATDLWLHMADQFTQHVDNLTWCEEQGIDAA